MSSELGAMREIKSRAALLQGFPKERKPLSQLALYFILPAVGVYLYKVSRSAILYR
jgi:hypothetical protein